MNKIPLIIVLLIAACTTVNLPPTQRQQQEQNQTQSQSNTQTASTAADQQSSHASDSKQGTNSMPVIIICNTVSSPGGRCIAPNPDGPINDHINRNLKGATK